MGLFREGVCLEFALVQSLRMIMGVLVTELPSRPGLRVRPARCGRPAAMSVPGRWLGSKYFDRIWRLRSLGWAGRTSPGWEQGCSGRLERPLGTAFSHRLVPLDVLQLPFPLLWLRSIPPLRVSRWCVDDCQMRHGLVFSRSLEISRVLINTLQLDSWGYNRTIAYKFGKWP
jgi:hypothetical protein